MALPTLRPVSQTSAITLPSGSNAAEASGAAANKAFPFEVYTDVTVLGNQYFLTGAADQVGYTYKKFGGDVLDIELTKEQVFAAYQEAVLEYSYILNIHQAKNSIGDYLGAKTGSFDEEGQLLDDTDLKDVALKFPKFKFDYVRRVAYGYSTEAGFGGNTRIYSASFNTTGGVQDYDLQAILEAESNDSNSEFYGVVGSRRAIISRVYYKTPNSMWRFYGYYGGLNTVGDLASYGQWADDSTFQLIPPWQNKAQAMAFEDAIYTRNSHWSYELDDNRIRIYPRPVADLMPKTMWVDFFIDTETPWKEDTTGKTGIDGINNVNTLPFENTPYHKINSIGKQWIRRFTLAVCKEMLGNIRSKFTTIPIPGDAVTLDGPALISQGQAEQEKLREELKTIFNELTYTKVAQGDAELSDAVNKIQERIPLLIFTG
jgi:hypothetical protein